MSANNIVNLVGNTPIVEVLSYKGAKIFAKLEYYNPTGSIKDRAALYMIKNALDKGKLTEGGLIVEATSGNTGIAIAMVAKVFKLKAIIVMPENMSKERQDLIRAFGAEVILTKKEKGMAGAVSKANEITKNSKNAIQLSQFENNSNIDAHFYGTGPEIYKFKQDFDWIVAPIGTGGTAMGIKKFFTENNLKTKIAGVEPFESPLLTKGIAGPHMIQGIGANFIPQLFKKDYLDDIITVKGQDAIDKMKTLAAQYGILSGISGGSAFDAAFQLIEKNQNIKNILIMIPDTGMRYLSSGIYG